MTDNGASEHRANEPCPDENLLVAFVEERLLAAEREPLEQHLVHCETCLDVVSEIARPDLGEPTVSTPRRVGSRPFLLIAAVVLIAVAIGLVARSLWTGDAPAGNDVQRLEAMLRSGAAELARSRAALFSGFSPLAREERLRPRPPVERSGGLVLLTPLKNVLTTGPTFAWESPAVAGPVEIVLHRIEGASRVDLDPVVVSTPAPANPRVPYPADRAELVPGKYQWRVRCDGALGPVTSSPRSFRIVSADEREAYRQAAAAIGAETKERIRLLLTAHLAIRRGLLDEAEQAVRRHLRSYPKDPIGRETLYHVLATIGSTEATNLLTAE